MSKTVEQKVVEMQFNNSNFEKNVSQSMSTLDKLKQALGKMSGAHAFEDLGKAADKLDFSKVGKETDTLGGKFDALREMATGAVRKIGEDVETYLVGSLKKAANALVIDNFKSGFDKYGQLMGSTQTMLSAIDGDEINGVDKLEYVEQMLEKLAWFSDETSYSFTDMTDNISKFVAAGLDLDVSTDAMMGIANWAAQAGQQAGVASRVMYQLSQAMGSGGIKLVDWKSVEIANMATKEVKDMLLEYGVAGGELIKIADGMYLTAGYANKSKEEIQKLIDTESDAIITANNFREHLTEEQWLTADVFSSAMGEYSAYANALEQIIHSDTNADMGLYASQLIGMIDKAADIAKKTGKTIEEVMKEKYSVDIMVNDNGTIHSALDGVTELAIKAMKSAQQARTLEQALDSVRDASSTKWMTVFKEIFGNVEEATTLFTNLSEYLYDFFVAPLDGLISTFKEWKSLGGWKLLFGDYDEAKDEEIPGALQNIVSAIEEVKKAIGVGIFGEDFLDDNFQAERAKELGDNLYELTVKFKDFTESLILTDEESAKISGIVSDLLNVVSDFSSVFDSFTGSLDAGWQAIKRFAEPVIEDIIWLFNSQLFRAEGLEPSGYQLLIDVFNDIFELSAAISEKLEPSERAIEELKTIFEGLNAAIDIVLSPLAFVHEEIRSLLEGDAQDPNESPLAKFAHFISGPFLESILWLPSKLGEALKALDAYLKEDNKVTNFLKNLTEFAKGFYDAMFPNGMLEKLKELKETISDFFNNLLGGSENIEKIKTKVKEVFDSVREFLSENLNYEGGKKAFEAIAGAVNSIKEAVQSFFADPKQAIKDAYDAVSKWIKENVTLEKIASTLSGAFSKIGTVFEENYDKVAKWLGLDTTFESVLQKLSDFGENIKNVFTNAYNAVLSFFGMFRQSNEEVEESVSTMTRSMPGLEEENSSSIGAHGRKRKVTGKAAYDVKKKEGSQLGTGPVGGGVGVMPFEAVAPSFTPFENFAKKAIEVFGKVAEAVTWVKDRILALWKAVTYVWKSIDISGWLERNFGGLGGFLDSVAKAVGNTFVWIFNTIKAAVNGISNVIKKVGASFKESGLGDTLKEFFGTLWDKIKDVAEGSKPEEGEEQVGLLTKVFLVIKKVLTNLTTIIKDLAPSVLEIGGGIGLAGIGLGLANIGKGFMVGVKSIREAVEDFGKAAKTMAFAEAFKQIGKFVLELVVAAIALTVVLDSSEGNANALEFSLKILASFIGSLLGAVATLVTIINPKTSGEFAKYMGGIGAFFIGLGSALFNIVLAVSALSGVIILLQKIPDGKGMTAFVEALASIAGFMVVMGVIAAMLGKSNLGGVAGAGVAMLLLSVAIGGIVTSLVALTAAIAILQKTTSGMEAFWKALGIIGAFVVTFGIVISKINGVKAGAVLAAGVTISVMTGCLYILGNLIKSMAEIPNPDKLLTAAGAIVAIGFVMGLFISAFEKITKPKQILKGAAAMILMSFAFSVVANVVKSVTQVTRAGGNEPLTQMLLVVGTVAALGVALYLVSKTEGDVLKAGTAMLAMAGALAVVTVLMTTLKNNLAENPVAMVGGLLMLAAVLAGLVVVAKMTAGLSGGFLIFAGATVILGVGLMALAAGIKAIAEAMVFAGQTFSDNSYLIEEILTAICTAIINSQELILQTLSTIILALIQAFLDSKEQFITMIVEFIEGILATLSEHMPTILTYLQDIAQQLWDFIVQFLEYIWVDIERWLGELYEKLKSFLETLIKDISGFVKLIIDEIEGCLEHLVDKIFEFVTHVIEKLSQLVLTILNTIKTLAEALIETVFGLLNKILSKIEEFIMNIIHAVERLWKEVYRVARGIEQDIVDFVSDVIADIKKLWKELNELINDIKEDVFTFVDDVIEKVFDTLDKILKKVGFTDKDGFGNKVLTEIETVINRVLEDISGFAQDFIQAALDILDSFVKGIVQGTQTVLNGITDLMTSIINWIPTFVNDMMQAFIDLINGIAEAIETHAPEFWKAIKRLGKAIIDAILYPLTGGGDGEGGGIFGLGKTILEGIGSGLTGAWEGIKGTFASVGGWIKGAISGALDKAGEIGENLLTGIKEGAEGAWATVKGGFEKVGGWISGTFKSIFGIHSPSKVFAEFGRYLMDGLALGIEDGSDKPVSSVESIGDTLTKIMDDLAKKEGAVSFDQLIQFDPQKAKEIQSQAEQMLSGIADAAKPFEDDTVVYNVIPSGSYANGDSLSSAFEDALPKIDEVIQSDEYTPTITPVLDLTEIQNGMGDVNSMMSSTDYLSGLSDEQLNAAVNASFDPYENYDGTPKVDHAFDISSKMSGLEAKFDEMIEKLANLKVILDSGALVGGISGQMDSALGNKAVLAGRGVM